MSSLEFRATTLRLTSTDEHGFLTPIGALVLTGVNARLHGRHVALAEQRELGFALPELGPEELALLDTEIQADFPRLLTLYDALQDVTVTSWCALEAWGSRSPDGAWPTLVVPSISFPTMGCGGYVGRKAARFSGHLHMPSCGPDAPSKRLPWASDGRRRRFAGALPAEPGDLWQTGTTMSPPPQAGPLPLQVTPYGKVPGALPRE